MSSERSVKDLSGLYKEAMAERVGFEPTVRFPVRSLSRRVLSTAQSPLRGYLPSYQTLWFSGNVSAANATRRNLTPRAPRSNDVRRKRIESASRIRSPERLATPRPDD